MTMNFKMGCLAVSMLVAVLCLPAAATIHGQSDLHSTNKTDFHVALDDMKASSYYGFVMLLQILQGEQEQVPRSQVTYFMPSDQALSDVNLQETTSISQLVLTHSVHQPLKFNNLLHFPTGTFIPSSFPNFMLRVSNNGRSGFYLNNVHIVNPNVCRNSRSISCHGVSGVLFNFSSDFHPDSPPATPPAPAPSSRPPPSNDSNPLPPFPNPPSLQNPNGPSLQNPNGPAVSPLSPTSNGSNGTSKSSASCMNLVYGSIILALTCSTATFLAIAQP